MRRRFPLFCLGLFLLGALPVSAQVDPDAWAQVPGILARIVPPTFPTNDFPITDYGAVNDGTTDSTAAISNAIAACTAAGGGRVVVPPGTFLTGAIHLKSNVNLHVTKNAVLRFSSDTNRYLPLVFVRWESTEVMNWSPFIYALDQENIALTGEGLLDGRAPSGPWPAWTAQATPDKTLLLAMAATNKPSTERLFGPGHFLRPYFIQPVRCRNVLIEGITLTNSPMWVISPCYSTNVTVRNVTVNTTGANSDGCDPDSCTDVLIRDCTFNCGDDCIAIKAGRDIDGRRVNLPSRNIVIQNCNFKNGHGGVTCGSETSGTITNVFAENCVMNSASLEKAIRFKSNAQRGGGIQHVYIRNCLIKTTQIGIHADLQYENVTTGPAAPLVQNIEIRDCAFANFVKPGGIGANSQPVFLRGQNTSNRIAWVNIINCRFATNATAANTLQNTTNLIRLNNRGGGV